MVNPSFKEMMNEVVSYGSCCECGACVLVCPHNVIDYIDSKPKQVAKKNGVFDFCGISEGIGCDVCAQVCPRLGEREHHLADQVFAEDERRLPRHLRLVPARRGCALYRQRGVSSAAKTVASSPGCWPGSAATTRSTVPSYRPWTPTKPCAPKPRAVTSVEDIIRSASSWYTYCPNNLALEEAAKLELENVAFVGVPCQITPVRKMQLIDPAYLDNGRKKEKHIERQRKHLKGFGERVKLNIGLLCSEVFTFDGLMRDVIEGEMNIPLTEIKKFNVKGKVLIYKHDGEVVEMNLKQAQEHARPECHHCADFSAELADISCGGVGAMDWTIVVLRSEKGEELFDRAVADGAIEVRPDGRVRDVDESDDAASPQAATACSDAAGA